MSDTPETDAETMQDEWDHVDTDFGPFEPSTTVPADFARELERERDEARADAHNYKEGYYIYSLQAESAERERDELQEKYDTLAVENMLEVNTICKQRDEAMDVLEEISLYLSSGIGDENTTAQQYKERIFDGIKHLAGHAWEERCKYEKLWKEAEDALMKIEEIFIDGDDTYEDWKNMGQIARTFLEKNA